MASLRFFEALSNYALQQQQQTELNKIMTSSTLVETVSINYEDFTEGFLTCGTCLYTYDNDEHSPKLLPCSHTLCRICLERIASVASNRDPSGTLRCPICRELISLPRGGVLALPPSFLVNQLLDLMAGQRREVIPKCSSHVTQELLYCESCDSVFCLQCTGGKHGGNNSVKTGGGSPTGGTPEHTVIPFSIAIKRMSEILLYKGQQCINKLDESAQNVLNEIQKLDQNSDLAFEDINRIFQEIINVIDGRRQELLNSVKKIREDKRAALREQLNVIEKEKTKLESQCSGFKCQVEVRNISKKINDLKEKLETIDTTMAEPKENCFLRFEHLHNSAIDSIHQFVDNFGSIRTSNTLPSLCLATVGKCSANLRSSALVVTYDNNGERQKYGGDPITVTLELEEAGNTVEPTECTIMDNRDGTYDIMFVPTRAGVYTMRIAILGRPIKNSPLKFEVSEHINPLCIYGCKGGDQHQFVQPTSLAIDDQEGHVYVLDTGNGRVKKLLQNQCNNSPFSFIAHIEKNGLENRAATGIAFSQQKRSLLVTNWRSKDIREYTTDGEFVQKFGHQDLLEPTSIVVNQRSGQVAVVDNYSKHIFVFHQNGKLNFKIERKFGVIGGICFHPSSDEIIVADHRLLVFAPDGEYRRELLAEANGRAKGQYCGVVVDGQGNLLAMRQDRHRTTVIQVIHYKGGEKCDEGGQLKFIIDSNDAKLRRPSCLATTNNDHVIVVDLGNDCIKKYRYC